MKARWLIVVFLGALLYACAGGNHYYRMTSKEVVLVLRAPKAEQVILFSSLDGFKPRRARNISGRWEVELPAKKAFTYFYRVDDAPYQPTCAMKEKDDFGDENCIFDPRL